MLKALSLLVLAIVAATGFLVLYSAALVARFAYAAACHFLLPTERTSQRGWCTVPKHLNYAKQ